MSNPRKKFNLSIGLIIVLALLGYGLFQSKNLILGPRLKITEPSNGTTLSYPLVTVKGSAKNIAYIELNDRQIFVNEKGEFEEKIIAPAGYSVMKLSVRDKFGKSETRLIPLYLPENKSLENLPSEEIALIEEIKTNNN